MWGLKSSVLINKLSKSVYKYFKLYNYYRKISSIGKKIDNTKRSLNGLDQLIPKYYESKIKKMLSSYLEKDQYKLKVDKGMLKNEYL